MYLKGMKLLMVHLYKLSPNLHVRFFTFIIVLTNPSLSNFSKYFFIWHVRILIVLVLLSLNSSYLLFSNFQIICHSVGRKFWSIIIATSWRNSFNCIQNPLSLHSLRNFEAVFFKQCFQNLTPNSLHRYKSHENQTLYVRKYIKNFENHNYIGIMIETM